MTFAIRRSKASSGKRLFVSTNQNSAISFEKKKQETRNKKSKLLSAFLHFKEAKTMEIVRLCMRCYSYSCLIFRSALPFTFHLVILRQKCCKSAGNLSAFELESVCDNGGRWKKHFLIETNGICSWADGMLIVRMHDSRAFVGGVQGKACQSANEHERQPLFTTYEFSFHFWLIENV